MADKKTTKRTTKTSIVNNAEVIKVLSALTQRAAVAAQLGMSYGTDRDLYAALGYKAQPTFNDYMARYTRQDVAKAVINAPVSASWRDAPRVTENEKDDTKFEQGWIDIVKSLHVYKQIVRADKLAGIGEYSVLLLGFDDPGRLSDEVKIAGELLYLQPYGKNNATVKTYVIDPKNRRYGLPETYNVHMKDPSGVTKSTIVHHTRIIHIAEELLEDNVDGLPRLECVLNRLEDLERVCGGSAEMFWRGAFPGYGFKIDDGFEAEKQDLTNLQDEIEEYMHGLKRYLKLKGVSIENFSQQVADPSKHADILITLISAATRIPKRILLGSERGELASSMDEKNWLEIIQSRQRNYCEPTIIRPLIDRLIEFNVLDEPKEGYAIEWPDLMAPSDKEIAEIGEVRSKALKNYVDSMGADNIVPPDMYLRKFLGMKDDDIGEINDILGEISEEEATNVELAEEDI